MTDSDARPDGATLMRSIIQRVATGPELSKSISLDEAREGMRMVLDGEADPVQAGIFLIALRMKRETDDEVCGILDAVRDATDRRVAPVDDVVDVADPYDGYNRTLPASPFLPAVLAACGVAAFSHGVREVGPKYGVTHHRVLAAAGVAADLPPDEVAARLGREGIGWGYVDQSRFCPRLHDLIDLRTRIVKRPAVTTVEVLAGAVVGARRTHLVTGYVHRPYPRIYALLARHAGYASALLVRGVEGGVVPSLRQAGRCFRFEGDAEETAIDLDPAALGIEQSLRAPPLPEDLPAAGAERDRIGMEVDADAAAAAAAAAGIEALEGRAGPVRDALVYAGALVLWHRGRHADLSTAADAVRRALDSGAARRHFEAGR